VERGYYSRSELALLVGTTPKTVAAWSRLPSFPESDGRDRFDGIDFLTWWIEKKATKAFRGSLGKMLGVLAETEEQTTVSAEDDFQQRRWRAKALQEELKLEAEQGALIRIEDVKGNLQTVAKHLRTGAEVLQRRFGKEAADILENAITEAEAELERIA
jgi:phage terminase Nu1 subunit (DNA packaging protein)